jgi:hypothetical protein
MFARGVEPRESSRRGIPVLIRKSSDGYISGLNKIPNLAEDPDAVRVLKKPIPIFARRIGEPFEVETTEGLMKGQAGDWLMQGVSGELYICPNSIFQKSYDILDK